MIFFNTGRFFLTQEESLIPRKGSNPFWDPWISLFVGEYNQLGGGI